MGGAFTAVADDATAFYWNPAGYKFGPIAEIGFAYGTAGDERAFGVATGFTFMGVAATSTEERVATELGPRKLQAFDLSVSILQSLPVDDLVIATNLHFLRSGFEGGERSGDFTLDAAALYEPVPWFRVGLMWRRLIEPEVAIESGVGGGRESVFRLERHARAGVSFVLPRATVLAFDMDLSRQSYGRELALGAEKAFFDRALSLRFGLRADQGNVLGSRPTVSFGVGGRIRWLVLDVAYETSAKARSERLFFGVALSL